MNKAMRQGLVYQAMGEMLTRHDRVPYSQHEYEEIGGTLWAMYHAQSKQIKDRCSRIRAGWRTLAYRSDSCQVLVFYDEKSQAYAGFHADVFTPAPPEEPQLLLPF